MASAPLTPRPTPSRRTWLIAIPVVILLAVVGGPFVYINFIKEDPPEQLTLDDAPAATNDTTSTSPGVAATPDGIEGAWVVGEGSQAGYRVKEVLFGQDTEGVGRTDGVTGTMTIAGTTVAAVEAEVDMTSVTSDESRRDGQFQGRIMSTDEFPTATFTLTEPIELGAIPADGEEVSATATGELTLRGVTREVTFDLSAKQTGGSIAVNAAIPVDFDEFEIPDASGGPATVGRDGTLELLLVFAR